MDDAGVVTSEWARACFIDQVRRVGPTRLHIAWAHTRLAAREDPRQPHWHADTCSSVQLPHLAHQASRTPHSEHASAPAFAAAAAPTEAAAASNTTGAHSNNAGEQVIGASQGAAVASASGYRSGKRSLPAHASLDAGWLQT